MFKSILCFAIAVGLFPTTPLYADQQGYNSIADVLYQYVVMVKFEQNIVQDHINFERHQFITEDNQIITMPLGQSVHYTLHIDGKPITDICKEMLPDKLGHYENKKIIKKMICWDMPPTWKDEVNWKNMYVLQIYDDPTQQSRITWRQFLGNPTPEQYRHYLSHSFDKIHIDFSMIKIDADLIRYEDGNIVKRQRLKVSPIKYTTDEISPLVDCDQVVKWLQDNKNTPGILDVRKDKELIIHFKTSLTWIDIHDEQTYRRESRRASGDEWENCIIPLVSFHLPRFFMMNPFSSARK